MYRPTSYNSNTKKKKNYDNIDENSTNDNAFRAHSEYRDYNVFFSLPKDLDIMRK